MLVIGLAFLVFAALVQFVAMTVVGAAFLVGAVLVVLALLLGERFPSQKP
jgi:hypothetical protein